MKNVLLIDGNSFFYRSYYASIKFTATINNSKNAVYTAIKILKKFLEKNDYSKIFFTFDYGKKTLRHKKWLQYKLNRKKTPDDLIKQIPIFEEFLKSIEIDFFKNPDFEADDLLASLAKMLLKENYIIDVVSSDHDLLQIIEKNVNLLLAKTGMSKMEKISINNFFDKYQIFPEQINDFKALIGDPSDNLPGIKGIGPKTALKLIKTFNNLEKIYENLEQIKDSIKIKLIEFKKDAFLTKDLSKIENNISFKINLREKKYDFYSLSAINFYKKHHMFSFLKSSFKQKKFEY